MAKKAEELKDEAVVKETTEVVETPKTEVKE